jgi:hypothetical protein
MNDTPRRPGGEAPGGAPGAAPDDALASALDAALRRELRAPELPAGFHERLRAAIARAPQLDHERLRREIEREQREALAALREGYVRLSREVFIALVGGACVLGAAAAVWLPEIAKRLDLDVGQLVAMACAAGAVGYAAWLVRRPLVGRITRWIA